MHCPISLLSLSSLFLFYLLSISSLSLSSQFVQYIFYQLWLSVKCIICMSMYILYSLFICPKAIFFNFLYVTINHLESWILNIILFIETILYFYFSIGIPVYVFTVMKILGSYIFLCCKLHFVSTGNIICIFLILWVRLHYNY